MKRFYKAINFAINFACSFGSILGSIFVSMFVCAISFTTANATVMTDPALTSLKAITLYAGPQSVTPEQSIHVTIEANDLNGNSLDRQLIELSYVADGSAKTMTAKTHNGLVSFDVPAQKTAGLMIFSAKAGQMKSANAAVIVKAGQPKALQLKVRPNKVAGKVNLSIATIADEFGNPMSGLSLVTIEWLDDLGVKVRQQLQLSKGQVAYTGSCPVSFLGSLKVRATFKNIENISPDISNICSMREG